MGETIRLQAADGHRFDAWIARPAGRPRGGLVVLQEIFGVNRHIRRVTESFAGEGYTAMAPALFDRVGPGLEFGYDQLDAGREAMMALDRANIIRDMSAAALELRGQLTELPGFGSPNPGNSVNCPRNSKVGAIGYCWGGALADLAACECGVDAAVSYYGRHTATWLALKPKCPVMYHFGKLDPLIPPETVAAIRAGRPGGIFHLYDQAGHGFNCDERHEYHAQSASLALERSLSFLHLHVG